MKAIYFFLFAFILFCTAEANAQTEKLPCDSTVTVPSAFTPNGDGINDHVIPVFEQMPYQFKFTVYNRWGSLIFETTDLKKVWFPDKEPEGTYYWLIKYKYLENGNWFECAGFITLLR